MHIPKLFMNGIRVPHGPAEGKMAMPCICGRPCLIDEEELWLISSEHGALMFCHPECAVVTSEEDED